MREEELRNFFGAKFFPRTCSFPLGLLVRPSRRHGRCRFPSDKGTLIVGGPVGAIPPYSGRE